MNMRWFWIRDKTKANVYNVYWNQGKTNRADYFSKQHPTKHHMEMRPVYIHETDKTAQNYFDTILEHQANWVVTIAAPTQECSKGVLISHSGLPQDAVSNDPHSDVTVVTEQVELDGDNGRCSNDHFMNTVDMHQLISYLDQP